MNNFVIPFVVKAGVFAAIGSQQGPTIAERIVSAISNKIIEDYPDEILEPEQWKEVVSNIPNQTAIRNVDSTRKFPSPITPSEWANECITKDFRQDSTADLTGGIKSIIETLPTLQSLNCFSISFSKSGDLLISLAMISLVTSSSLKLDLNETLVNYSNQKIAGEINDLFDSFDVAYGKPYFVSVKPK